MTEKISLTLDIDDSQLDAAQAKAVKLVETLREAERLIAKLDKCEIPPSSDSCWWHKLNPAEITC